MKDCMGEEVIKAACEQIVSKITEDIIIKAADNYIHKRITEDDCGRTGDTFPAFIEGAEWVLEEIRKI